MSKNSVEYCPKIIKFHHKLGMGGLGWLCVALFYRHEKH